MRAGSLPRTMVELGLVGVVATQLWHHLFIDPTLADLPSKLVSGGVVRGEWSGPHSPLTTDHSPLTTQR
jgi:asparagine synthase (glutamine-hydrolysing)